MKCPNCRCEIGNLTTCPYCGVVLYRRPSAGRAPQAPPRVGQPSPRTPARSRSDQRRDRHLANLASWGILTVVLLSGIFVLELLQLLLQFQ